MALTVEEIFNELEVLKSEIAEAKQQKAEKTGQLSEQMKSLKNFDVDSVLNARKKVVLLKKKETELEQSILSGFTTLQEKYEW